ncbi:hypothetical protein EB834_15160 [Brevibacterium aurantiacum]|uniref:Uncharacterized protein n=2 Tax=Brevibacteriaceae TaxID=85019 RepID=A0A4Z0KG96_BREAU|nr:hypothetical protein EB834_15160 [Brevibacterium aurantiacum]
MIETAGKPAISSTSAGISGAAGIPDGDNIVWSRAVTAT